MNIDLVIESIEAEGRSKKRVLSPEQRRLLQHRDISLRTPTWRRVLNAVKSIRHNPNELMHYVFRIPVLGYLLNLISYGLRLPTQLRKLREDIASIHQHMADIEARLTKMTFAEVGQLNSRLKGIEARIQTLDIKRHD